MLFGITVGLVVFVLATTRLGSEGSGGYSCSCHGDIRRLQDQIDNLRNELSNKEDRL